jgi:hypothetical protein
MNMVVAGVAAGAAATASLMLWRGPRLLAMRRAADRPAGYEPRHRLGHPPAVPAAVPEPEPLLEPEPAGDAEPAEPVAR